ncbi:STT3 subunit of Oligosaccharyl transferase [Neocallimastix lanati (nom. inval.)]|nr:STT3 subunit of Oligosaccharyl transferase [Neocallimastix sp. JGI-2020a]
MAVSAVDFKSLKKSKDLLCIVILALIAILAFISRLLSVVRFESVIHEFDPWFNYRATQYLVNEGFYKFLTWFDQVSWYPLGRVVGGTLYPGIMITSGIIYKVLHFFNFNIDIRHICVFLGPVFSGLTSIATYLLTKEVCTRSAGLFAAAFVAIAPGYISRSVAGSYDNEAISIFLLMITFYFWVKSVKTGSSFWAACTALFYFYMVSAWGGYIFIINLIPLHVFALLLMGRYSQRLYVAYSTFYVLGTIGSMQIPFVGFQPATTAEHMGALGTFGLLQIVAFVHFCRSHLSSDSFKALLKRFLIVVFFVGVASFLTLQKLGIIDPWTGRLYSLFDTGYAKKHIPIIASVSEHQPTAWPSFFFDLHILVPIFPVGIYFAFKKLTDESVFIILYAFTASYFAGVMVRLMLTLTPIVCVAGGICMSYLLDNFLAVPKSKATVVKVEETEDIKEAASGTESAPESPASPASPKMANSPRMSKRKNEIRSNAKSTKKDDEPSVITVDVKFIVICSLSLVFFMYVLHCTWVTSNAYSSPSIVLASRNRDGSQRIIDDFREAYYWLRQNSPEDSKIMSWWDYGYQLAGMTNRTTLVDNNTWNNTHIATVGRMLASNEENAYVLLRKHDVDYALVMFGGAIGYSGDDINKFLWMIRITEGVYPDQVKEENFYNSRGEYRVDDSVSPTLRDSIMYKMSYYRFKDLYPNNQAFDRVRGTPVYSKPIQLSIMDEVYSSENLLVRIYKIKKPDNIGRSLQSAAKFNSGRRRKRNRKSRKSN